MKILVTGATGFIGNHVVTRLLENSHEVWAVGRTVEKASLMPWYDKVRFLKLDIHQPIDDLLELCSPVDAVMHLAWEGLPNYNALFHFEDNLPADCRFLRALVQSGINHLLVTGTCLECGMQNGELSEEVPTFPCNPYALAKDTLRRFLQVLKQEHPFILQWVRLFYTFGPGQNPNSLLAQLDRAIDDGESEFKMSKGEQLRDYLPVEEVAHRLVQLVEHPEVEGVINCCSGNPVSVRRLVEERIKERSANIRLNLGYYRYPDYEPMAFWGNSEKLSSLLEE